MKCNYCNTEMLEGYIPTPGIEWVPKYKEKKLKDRLPELSLEEKYALLATDGMLVKRPILVTEKGVVTGFKPEDWEKLT